MRSHDSVFHRGEVQVSYKPKPPWLISCENFRLGCHWLTVETDNGLGGQGAVCE